MSFKTKIMQWKYLYKMRHHHQYFLCLIELNFFLLFHQMYLVFYIVVAFVRNSHIWVLLPNGAIDICLHVNYDKTQFYVLWCSFPFYATYFIRCHRMSSYVGTVLCVFCCLNVLFYFFLLFKHLDGPKRLKPKNEINGI